jgi:DNA polymerase I-like protein with 3'-5' exonuclease and polymerase domains
LKLPAFATVDFETEAIARRPHYPPRPNSVAIKKPGERKGKFYSWSQNGGNNCTFEEAKRALLEVWRSDWAVLCQNGKFDLDIAETHCGMKPLPWERCHDTLYLLFLDNPHSASLSLKPSAERLLGVKLSERDALRDWLVAKGIVKKNQKDWGAYICKAPGDVVGPYALDGDVTHTEAIFRKLYPSILERGMGAAYDRERRLQPVLLKAERGGIRADLVGLERDFKIYTEALATADRWLRMKLRAPNLNLDADKDLGDVLDRESVVVDWTWTAGGKGRAPQRSVSKKNMQISKFLDQEIALVYAYRVRCKTCLSMFFEPWIAGARESDGVIYYNMNSVRQSHSEGKLVGARTGRPSSDHPNFFNVSKDFEDKDDGYKHPAFELKIAVERQLILESLYAAYATGRRAKFLTLPGLRYSLPPLPLMRTYLLPDEGGVWGHRDYNQQELRMTGHFEGGGLAARYNEEPYRWPDCGGRQEDKKGVCRRCGHEHGGMRFDIHSTTQTGIKELTGILLTRPGTKILNFSDLYGKGLALMAEGLGVDLKTMSEIRSAKAALMPGVAALTADVKSRGTSGGFIRTWGGRQYYVEPPKYVKKFKRVMDFSYKLLNYLIQGSSADVTKEALIRYDGHPKREARFLVTVYDEINSSAPLGRLREEMEILRECMEGLEGIDVPMLTDGKTGPSWGKIKKWRD